MFNTGMFKSLLLQLASLSFLWKSIPQIDKTSKTISIRTKNIVSIFCNIFSHPNFCFHSTICSELGFHKSCA